MPESVTRNARRVELSSSTTRMVPCSATGDSVVNSFSLYKESSWRPQAGSGKTWSPLFIANHQRMLTGTGKTK
jgi:hypothetical protein